ncbi:MAG TPA: hypothetical protein VF779_15805 [Pyrinomonadaceae bacterium]
MSSGRFLRITTFVLILSLSTQLVALCKRVAGNDEKEKSAQPVNPPNNSAKTNLFTPEQPLISRSSRPLTTIDKTYLDVYTILKENNSCSRFFGGSTIATVVLNFLYPNLKEKTLDQIEIGIVMSGAITTGSDEKSGLLFRLFENAVINRNGPFFQSFNPKTHRFFNKVGDYPANTREARAVMILHELGHLTRGANGQWLLPNDGGNLQQVIANTDAVLEQCNEQVKALSHLHTETGEDAPAQLNARK